METPASSDAPTAEFRSEQCPMTFLMRHEMRDLGHQARSTPPREPTLRAIDADGAMLTRMIDLQDCLAQCLGAA